MSIADKNREIRFSNKKQVVDLEKFYVNASVDNLNEIVEQKKKEIVEQLQEFQEKYIKYDVDRNGNEHKVINPYLISTYFFKSINPLSNVEPEYSSEKLAIVWGLYMYLVEKVNEEIDCFHPTLSHFCRFAGISTSTLRNYRDSGDMQMRILINKIYDETYDSNLTFAQTGVLNARATQYRLKSENEVQEKPKTNVNISRIEVIDVESLNKKYSNYNVFNEKKKKLLGKKNDNEQ